MTTNIRTTLKGISFMKAKEVISINDIQLTVKNEKKLLSYNTKKNMIFILCIYFPIACIIQFFGVGSGLIRILSISWSICLFLLYLGSFFYINFKTGIRETWNREKYNLSLYAIVQISTLCFLSTGLQDESNKGVPIYLLSFLIYSAFVFIGIKINIEFRLMKAMERYGQKISLSALKINLIRWIVALPTVTFIVLFLGMQLYRMNKWWLRIISIGNNSWDDSLFMHAIGMILVVALSLIPIILFDGQSFIKSYLINKYNEEFRQEYKLTEKEFSGQNEKL